MVEGEYLNPASTDAASIWSSLSLHERHLDKARSFVSESQYQAAVVFAQVACELGTEQVFRILFEKNGCCI